MEYAWLSVLRAKRLSIIVPVYNEGFKVRSNLNALLNEVHGFFDHYEILVVSDGSTDATNSILSSMATDKVKPILLPRNHGKGFSLRSAYHQCTGDYILFIDGDMEIHPREVRIFIGLQALYDADIVIGSKRHPQSKLYYPFFRRLLSWCFSLLVRTCFSLKVTDTQVGLKLMRAEVIRAILPKLKIDGYGADLELLVKAQAAGFTKILEAPITIDYFSNRKHLFIYDVFRVLKMGCILLLDLIEIRMDLARRP